MEMTRYTPHKFPARINLVDYVEASLGVKIKENLAENGNVWVPELDTIYQIIHGRPLSYTESTQEVHTDEKAFICNNSRSQGLWFNAGNGNWRVYDIGQDAEVYVSNRFPKVSPTSLLPQVFPSTCTNVEKVTKYGPIQAKRLICKLDLTNGQSTIPSYVKGDHTFNYFFDSTFKKPHDRITDLRKVERAGSRREVEFTDTLAYFGVSVPRIIGFYESVGEDFVFMDEISGQSPHKCLTQHREEIIRQDAQMLARMSLAGICKGGFADFDDKIFDGKTLYLIDVDECDRFEKGEKHMARDESIKRSLRDVLFDYRYNLLANPIDKSTYVREFYKEIGLGNPSSAEIRDLSQFPENYKTRDTEATIARQTL